MERLREGRAWPRDEEKHSPARRRGEEGCGDPEKQAAQVRFLDEARRSQSGKSPETPMKGTSGLRSYRLLQKV